MLILPLLLLSTLGLSYSNKIILVRHGEKEGAGNGLNKIGIKRAKCFRQLFSPKNPRHGHDIGLIVAQSYDKESRARSRPYETVKYLANDLGLRVNVKWSVLSQPSLVRFTLETTFHSHVVVLFLISAIERIINASRSS